MSTNAERFGQIVKARRWEELQLSQLEVYASGGPSNTKLTEIENGRLENLTRGIARKLDRSLRWEPGSAQRAWEGGEPHAILHPELSGRDSRWLRAQIEAADEIDEAVKDELLQVLEERRRSG